MSKRTANSPSPEPLSLKVSILGLSIEGSRGIVLTVLLVVTLLAAAAGAGYLLGREKLAASPEYNAPLVGLSVRATVAALPTATPYPTYTPLPTHTPVPTPTPAPAPAALIVAPEYLDGPVPAQSEALVNYTDLPPGSHLWIVVQVPKVRPGDLVFPQLLSGLPEPVAGNGSLRLKIQLGSLDADAGEPFNLMAVLVGDLDHALFLDYAQACLADKARCTGLRLGSESVILDVNTVLRR